MDVDPFFDLNELEKETVVVDDDDPFEEELLDVGKTDLTVTEVPEGMPLGVEGLLVFGGSIFFFRSSLSFLVIVVWPPCKDDGLVAFSELLLLLNVLACFLARLLTMSVSML